MLFGTRGSRCEVLTRSVLLFALHRILLIPVEIGIELDKPTELAC